MRQNHGECSMRPSLLALSLVGLAVGCSSAKVGSVSGKVTLDGKPVANARVNFQPTGETLNPGIGSFGKANANGEYTLSLIDGSSSGAIVGKHKVAISAYDHEPNPNATDERRGAP